MLEISRLKKKYKEFQALDGIDIKIEAGVFGLLGPNGAGKTTLMKCIATLITDFSGEIKYGDISWKKGQENNVKKLIGYLPQNFTFYNNITVFEALEHIQTLKTGKSDYKELDNILEKVNLINYKNNRIKSLSGGMLRRVGIAQAIIGNPKILIIDEPTAGLDPLERVRFRSLIYSLSKENIVIISTHIVEDLESISKTIAFINNGKIVYHNSNEEIIKLMRNKVCELEVDNKDLNQIILDKNIIAIKSYGEKSIIRFLAKGNDINFVEPTIEDAYYNFIGVGDVEANK
ncbi:MAG: ATP-binding cassette domain-containing protein [Clostridium sp.]